MAKQKNNIAKLSNSFSTGGGGGSFERRIQAVFLLSLLIDGFSPILNMPMERVAFQARQLGDAVDDMVVFSTSGAKLLCQMKHSLPVSAQNATFQEVMRAAWHDFCAETFSKERDKIALFTGFIAKDSTDALRFLHDQAVAAADTDDFFSRMEQAQFTSQAAREKLEIIRSSLQQANGGAAISQQMLWQFCKCFLLAIFDLDYEESINRTLAQTLIRCKATQDARLIWSYLTDLCATYNQQAAVLTRQDLPGELLEWFGWQQAEEAAQCLPAGVVSEDVWAALLLVGTWDENKPADLRAVEQIAEKPYGEIQRQCRALLNSGADGLLLRNGIWRVKSRRQGMAAWSQYFFDGTVKNAFQVANGFLREINRQISEHGGYSLVIPENGRFTNSEGLRNRLLEGLCILANETSPHCTQGLIARNAQELVYRAMEGQTWEGLSSLHDLHRILAELSPKAYLDGLETLILQSPEEVLQLFPTKRSNAVLDRNEISNILFALEQLAWDERYLVSCIRCLGELECLPYEQTNWANTPIHSIVEILNPLLPQTLASVEKQEHAVQGLRRENRELYWKVLLQLLPRGGMGAIRCTVRPKYLNIHIPENTTISGETFHVLVKHYFQHAVSLAAGDPTKLAALLQRTSHVPEEDVILLLQQIQDAGSHWGDEEACALWMELCDQKYRAILHNEKKIPDTVLFQTLCATIEAVRPKSILYRHRRLFLSHMHPLMLEDDGWEKLDRQKQRAVQEIYQAMDITAVIQFGKAVDALAEVGRRLGQCISAAEFFKLLPAYRAGEESEFYSNLVSAFLYQHGIDVLRELDLTSEKPEFLAQLLCHAPFNQALLDVLPVYLPGQEALFWQQVKVSPCDQKDCGYDLETVLRTLLHYHRASAAIDVVGFRIAHLNLPDPLLYDILLQASTEEEAGKVRPYNALEILKHLQGSDTPDFATLSKIEFLYLPWMPEGATAEPKAIQYRLSNEPAYFCELIELAYKRHHDETPASVLPQALSDRLFQLLYPYKVVPGTDWNGVFHPDRFTAWLEEVTVWARENDRYEVTMQTVGNGLSYAAFDAADVLEPAIMEALNDPAQSQLRNGYRLGIHNQRGVHYVDPESKEEKALAEAFQRRASAVEALGYTRFSEELQRIAEHYLAEAQGNARHYAEERKAKMAE